MITDEERREVARKLRELPIDMYELARKLEAEGTMSSGGEETDWSQIHDAVFGCWPPEYPHPCDYEDMHNRLAALIEPPERTCRAVGEDPLGFRSCSSCGYEAWADEDSVTPYCPMCGSKVVE